jgi:hypothetical protein
MGLSIFSGRKVEKENESKKQNVAIINKLPLITLSIERLAHLKEVSTNQSRSK